jgi:hypothetical protein
MPIYTERDMNVSICVYIYIHDIHSNSVEESISTVEFLYLVAEMTAATVAVCPSSGEDHGSAAMEPTSWSSSSGMLASDGLIC